MSDVGIDTNYAFCLDLRILGWSHPFESFTVTAMTG